MAISLQDLRDAYTNYASQHLQVVVAPLEAILPWLPRRGEEFLFEIYVQNASENEGGMPIADVRFILTATRALIFAPALPGIREVRSRPSSTVFQQSRVLKPGELASYMVIFPALINMAPGGSIKLNGLRGKVLDAGVMNVSCEVKATINIDRIFPKDAVSRTAQIEAAVS